jgi:hypothetical protein
LLQVLDAAKKLRLAYLEEDENKIILKAIIDIDLPPCCRCWMPRRS